MKDVTQSSHDWEDFWYNSPTNSPYIAMTKTKIPMTNEQSFLYSIHKCNLTGAELSTILYCLEGYIQGNDDYSDDSNFSRDIDRIFTELQSVTDNYYAQLEEEN